jgi:hypothetical protein
MNIIESNLIKQIKHQKFMIKTDCEGAKQILEKPSNKVFKQNIELYNQIKETYQRILIKAQADNKDFLLQWIPRDKNKKAHKCAYNALKNFKLQGSNILITEGKKLLKVLKKFNTKQCKVLIYLYLMANENKEIYKTQAEVSNSLEIAPSSICKIYKELISLKILKKVSNGKYLLLK